MIDYMKEAKILYLADVLEDIAKEMERDFHNRPFCKSINDIVKELRETLALTTPTDPANMREERMQIKRIEKRYRMAPVPGIPDSEMPCYEDSSRRCIISELLDYIREENLIRVRKVKTEQGCTILTASLIVVIEQEPDIPRIEEQVTFVDSLAKYLDETRQ
jgi:hypothetical protein